MSASHKAAQKYPDLVDGDWSAVCKNEWELLTGVMLDTRTPIERLRKVLQMMKSHDTLDFRVLQLMTPKQVENELRYCGYPWARQKATYFQQAIRFDLKTATLEQIDSIKGIGPKLANLWMRFMNPGLQDDFCVIDTHVRRWMRDNLHINDKQHTYAELTLMLQEAARQRGLTISQLDEEIVTAGIRKRRGL